MGKCSRKEPYSDFLLRAKQNEQGTWESPHYIYTPDGLWRLKKTHISSIDASRCDLGVLLEIKERVGG